MTMSHLKIVLTLVLVLAVAFVVTGCDTSDGPLEQAGENLDEGAKDIGKGLEEAGEDMQDAADDVKDRLD